MRHSKTNYFNLKIKQQKLKEMHREEEHKTNLSWFTTNKIATFNPFTLKDLIH